MNIKRFCKKLRHNLTDAESILWYHLRDRRFQNCKFRRQVEVGRYIADFLSYEKNLIVELDGGQHNEAENILKDQKRTAYLELRGYKVLRFWNNEVLTNKEGVLEEILKNISWDD